MIPAVYAPKLVISVLAIAVLGNSIVSYFPVSENERVPYEEKGIGSHAQNIQNTRPHHLPLQKSAPLLFLSLWL